MLVTVRDARGGFYRDQAAGEGLGVPEELWERVGPVFAAAYHRPAAGRLPPDPRRGDLPARRPRTLRAARRSVDFRRIPDGAIFRPRSGVQWNKVPTEFGDESNGPPLVPEVMRRRE